MSEPVIVSLPFQPAAHTLLAAVAALEGFPSPEAYIMSTMATNICTAITDANDYEVEELFTTGRVARHEEGPQ